SSCASSPASCSSSPSRGEVCPAVAAVGSATVLLFRGGPDLLSHLLEEGLRTEAVLRLVIDDLAGELPLRVVGERRVADVARELHPIGRRRPRLLLDDGRAVRRPVMRL